ncbi:MAG: hypothetical protein ACRC11_15190 [Xenococcaceae cyanobacterium]
MGLTVTACGGQEEDAISEVSSEIKAVRDTQPVKQETSDLEWVQLALF